MPHLCFSSWKQSPHSISVSCLYSTGSTGSECRMVMSMWLPPQKLPHLFSHSSAPIIYAKCTFLGGWGFTKVRQNPMLWTFTSGCIKQKQSPRIQRKRGVEWCRTSCDNFLRKFIVWEYKMGYFENTKELKNVGYWLGNCHVSTVIHPRTSMI